MAEWKDCPGCLAEGRKLRILAEYPACQEHGGPMTNCRTCGTGQAYWFPIKRPGFMNGYQWQCPTCQGNPEIAGSGRPDYADYSRAKMIAQFGPRMAGDVELLERYRAEV